MPKVSAKRQITLPIEQCREAHIEPGDLIETFIHNNQITIVKKEFGAAKGILKNAQTDKTVTDEQSLQSMIDERNEA